MACGSTKTIERLVAGPFVFGLIFGATASAQDRMPPIPADKLTPAQKKTVDEYKKARGGEPSGPWAVLTRSPELMSRTLMLSDYLRFNSTLPPRLSEFVILMTAREWGQNYEWNAHQPLAIKGGLNPEVAKAIAEGRRPVQRRKMRRACTISSRNCSTTEQSATPPMPRRCRSLGSRQSWTR
jgi:4-carboxymuconolactone decarboxylase